MNRSRQSGVSLLEALVSLVVMAIGTVAVLAMQATLRSNGDLAKQRSEAVRLAQQKVEEWRGFKSIDATAGVVDWTDILDTVDGGIAGSSALFDRTASVTTRGAADDDALSKTVNVTVSWTDRTGQAQSIALRTALAGAPPELAGSLSVELSQSLLVNPGGRHPAIPRDAVPLDNGTSSFTPPGAPLGTVWSFNNATGLITDAGTPKQFVTGFVRFALGAAPGSAESEHPVDAPVVGVGVKVDQTAPVVNPNLVCFTSLGANHIQYFCAVEVTVGTPAWTGKVLVDDTTLSLAATVADTAAAKYRVCRYTPVRGCHPVVGSVIWGTPGFSASCVGADPTPQRKMTNQEHPLDHAAVDGPLVNQNFLVIKAGNGALAYDCPDDDAATKTVQGTTWHHQPNS